MLVPETPARDESETQFETTIISTCEDHGDPVVIPESEMDGFSFELEQNLDDTERHLHTRGSHDTDKTPRIENRQVHIRSPTPFAYNNVLLMRMLTRARPVLRS